MGCDFPIKAYRSGIDPSTGKPGISFNSNRALNSDNPMMLPCGRCSGCRLERARQWAVRCTHEAQLYLLNTFITLTYDDKYLPEDYGLRGRDLTLFFKRLRKSLPQKIRYLASGEYGDTNLRPHYHAIIFNHDFLQKTYWGKSDRGDIQYTSPELSKLWPQGLATFGAVTFESASYVARYSMKKIGGEKAAEHYTRIHPLTGKISVVSQEFLRMSRRPGLGSIWLDRFKSDVFPHDYVVMRGAKAPVPRFYEKQLSEEELEMIKRRRRAAGLRFKDDRTPARLEARRIVRDAKISTLKRKL